MTRYLSSKDILIEMVGIQDVHAYERVKALTMQIGNQLARVLLERVDGREALNGEGCDGITSLGKWEFCTQQNTKNKAGREADEARCPGRCVQILGRPEPGWISGQAFLELHGVPGDELDGLVEATKRRVRWDDQRRLPV